jgi:hypothetical protein
MSPLIRLVSWLPWLADRDSVDDAVARAALLRPDVKIIIQKGHTKGMCWVSDAAVRPAQTGRGHDRVLG